MSHKFRGHNKMARSGWNLFLTMIRAILLCPLRHSLLPITALLALSGCLLVDDFSPEWKKGKTDSCTSKIAQALYYTEFRRDPEGKEINELARSFSIEPFHFLMLKQNASDAGGRLYRFNVENGIFQRYRVNPVMRKTFEADYPNAPVSLARDTITLKKLGSEEMKLLTEISAKPEYWEIEDQTLYNTLRNPLCIYEDRDLAALEAKDKAPSNAKGKK